MVGLALVALALRGALHPDFPEGPDSVLFARGVEHYSLLSLRPHWPGYPLYILAGRLFLGAFGEPLRALHALSCVASSLCVLPLCALVRLGLRAQGASERQAWQSGLVASALWTVAPLAWLDGSEAFSDPLALLAALSMLWACCRALAPGGSPVVPLLTAALLGGAVLGIRLSYGALLPALGVATWRLRSARGPRGLGRLAGQAAALFAAGVLAWLCWQLAQDGSGFFRMARQHLTGHFTRWGGSVATDARLSSRPGRMLWTLWVHGLGGAWPGWGWQRLPASVLWGALLPFGLVRLARAPSAFRAPVLAWILPYALWSALAHDVDLARYTFPQVALLCLLAGLGSEGARLGWAVAAIPALAWVSAPLALLNRESKPVALQLSEDVRARLGPDDALLLPEVTPFLSGPGMPACIPVDRLSFEPKREGLVARGRAVFTTSAALEATGAASTGWVEVARFRQDPRIQSRGPWTLRLYRYAP